MKDCVFFHRVRARATPIFLLFSSFFSLSLFVVAIVVLALLSHKIEECCQLDSVACIETASVFPQ